MNIIDVNSKFTMEVRNGLCILNFKLTQDDTVYRETTDSHLNSKADLWHDWSSILGTQTGAALSLAAFVLLMSIL